MTLQQKIDCKIKLIKNNKKAYQKGRIFTFFLRKSLLLFLKVLTFFLKIVCALLCLTSNGQSIPFIPVLKLNQWQKSWINYHQSQNQPCVKYNLTLITVWNLSSSNINAMVQSRYKYPSIDCLIALNQQLHFHFQFDSVRACVRRGV